MRLGRNKKTSPSEQATARRRPNYSTSSRYNSSNFSYHDSRSSNRVNVGRVDIQSNSTRPKSKWRWLWRHSLIIVSSLVILFCITSELAVSPKAQVVILDKNQQTTLVTQDHISQYSDFANKLINGSLSNKNKLTINTSSINSSMKKHFPELDSVSVVLPFLGNRPKIYVQAYQPAFALKTKNGTFIVNKSGKAIARTQENLARQLEVPIVTDDSDLVAEVGVQVLSSDDGVFIDYIHSELAKAHFNPSSLVLAASRELDVSFQGKAYFAKFNLQRGDPRQQVGAFVATANQLERQGKTPQHYIDLHLDGRAYYK